MQLINGTIYTYDYGNNKLIYAIDKENKVWVSLNRFTRSLHCNYPKELYPGSTLSARYSYWIRAHWKLDQLPRLIGYANLGMVTLAQLQYAVYQDCLPEAVGLYTTLVSYIDRNHKKTIVQHTPTTVAMPSNEVNGQLYTRLEVAKSLGKNLANKIDEVQVILEKLKKL